MSAPNHALSFTVTFSTGCRVMLHNTTSTISIGLLADHPHLIPAVGEMRWREWGHAPEPERLEWWVAIDGDKYAVGAVGLGEFDIEERGDRSPWVLGMIVDPVQRM
jgi:hypothetical protein